jgi:putative molybdopterin biosynthesis protein
LEDLLRPDLRFINRQQGSGTRVWLDAALRQGGLPVEKIHGYGDERMTHSEVAAAVAAHQADVGIGLEEAAQAYGLDFIFLVQERYDLVIPSEKMKLPSASRLVSWLASAEAKKAISDFGGYDAEQTGNLLWVE